jgi:hypothetical protein
MPGPIPQRRGPARAEDLDLYQRIKHMRERRDVKRLARRLKVACTLSEPIRDQSREIKQTIYKEIAYTYFSTPKALIKAARR